MGKVLKHIALLFALIPYLMGNAQNIKYIYIKDLPSNSDYTLDFKSVSDNVNKKYTHLKSKSIDGKLLQSEYLALVKNAKNNLEYGDLLIRYFAALKNSHSNVIFNKYYRNCAAILIEDRVFLSYVADSIFIKNEVQEKDEILKINTIPVLEYLQNQAKNIPASTALHQKYLAVSGLFSTYFEEDRIYTIKTLKGEKDIRLHFDQSSALQAIQSPSQSVGKVESKILNDHTAYISILSMTGEVVDEFARVYDKLSNKEFLIIDVRRNQGGNSGYSEKIAEYLIPRKQKACVSNRWLTPKDNHYAGKLFVLTSPYTVSAAESFVLYLLESGNAVLIGMPTAGDTGNQPQFYTSKLGYSYWFPSRDEAQESPKGFPMEGESIKPHYTISKTIADYFENKDTILEYTLKIIRQK